MSYGVNSLGVGSYGAPVVESGDGGLSISCTTGTATAYGFDADFSNAGLTISCDIGTASASGYTASVTSLPAVTKKIAFIGDSNGDGRLSNNQPFTGTGSYVYKHDGSVVAMSDPVGAGPYTYSVFDDGNGTGSLFPRVAQSYYSNGQSILAVPCCKGGTQASNWTRSTLTTTLYGAMKARIDAVGGVDKIVIFLGANDAIGGVSQSTFVSRINTLISDLHGDFPSSEIYLQKIHDFTGYGTNVQVIRAGVQQVWENNATVKRGADLDGITTSVHYTTDADGIAASARTYAALEGVSIVGLTGTATASGFDAAFSNSSGLIVNCDIGYSSASGYSANVANSLSVTATVGAATAAGYTAAIELAFTVAASIGSASANGFDANVQNSAAYIINCAISAADAVGFDALFQNGTVINCGVGNAAAYGYECSVLLVGARIRPIEQGYSAIEIDSSYNAKTIDPSYWTD
jgi:hypothetical protein